MTQVPTIRDRIFNTLSVNGPLTKAEISRLTSLSLEQINRTVTSCLQKGQIQIQDGRIVLVEDAVFGPCIEASKRGPGNIIFQICKRNWRGYHVHQLFNASRRTSV
ncbi:TPA: hypothetical protein ACF1H3_003792 [Salmonella enterica]|nr:hypothetical protein [Salmonella enterica]EAU0719428.1 hypothetical protein [Salmonella enterica]EBK5126067.1 hypothetical protein [Salmonella enterica]EBQ5259586.1 hypothetical protein [Salmonella enterica]EGA9634049.1 hypothetical protein [Salmonella enterica]